MAVPGAAVGSLAGSLFCGVAGGAVATKVAQEMTNSDLGYVGYIKLVCATACVTCKLKIFSQAVEVQIVKRKIQESIGCLDRTLHSSKRDGFY
jgi:hypothetical protein